MLSKLSKREKRLLYLLLCLAVAAGWICLLILPAFSRNIAMNNDVTTVLQKQQDMKNKQEKLEENQNKAQLLGEQAEELYQNQFTQDVNVENIDRFVTAVARNAGITPQSLSIGSPEIVTIKNYEELQAAVTVALPSAEGSEEKSSEADQSTGEKEYLLYRIIVAGNSTYDEFTRLADAYQNCKQLLVTNLAFVDGGNGTGAFTVQLGVYTLPARGVE